MVATFSQRFPSFHPRKGEPTQFVEKLLLSFIDIGHISISKACEIGRSFNLPGFQYIDELRKIKLQPKHHTIRAGNRWKPGDMLSPRVWSGIPYNSKQIHIAHPVEVKKVWKFEVDECGVPSLDNFYMFEEGAEERLATNDGLSYDDFTGWIIMPAFRKGKAFTGQIICWNEEITY